MFIQWKEELALGNALIDTQHRMLMLLCRKLDIAIKTGQPQRTVRRVLLEVKKFTEFHFISEQNLMHEIGYPDVEKHARIHTELLIEIQVQLSRIQHGVEFPEDVLYELHEWFSKHVINEDLQIATYVKSSLQRPIGEDLYEKFLLQGGEP
ncbi:bacteriohemerythrin [Rhodoferax sp. GW822-FHT02A01]|jgi:hemerythrin-like metal-binding protein|uniref:bacteriohemerythrin n=1 Tax=Rhodoferax sp. GW822-FHT02A01 TaxID=3141537 RepID=UPI00315D4CD7